MLYEKSKNDIVSLPNDICEMLNEHLNITIDKYEHLSVNQKKALELFKKGKNILLIGAGGCGKSEVLKTFKDYNENRKDTNKIMYVTSTTGISAYNINGITIHSLMGIGTGELEIEALIRKVWRKKCIRDRIINTDILIIDEASMLSANLFEKLDLLCKAIRKNNKFFGGIQLILSMDPLQLLPVFNKVLQVENNDERLIIESEIFNNEFSNESKLNNIILLIENFRQKNDPTFINLLLRIRNGTFTEQDIDMLNKRKILPENTNQHIHLVSSNKKAQIINEKELDTLPGEIFTYKSIYKTIGNNKDVTNLLENELKFQFKQKGINELQLKKNARIMLIKNIDVPKGLVNGALGTIINLTNSYIEVEFDNKIIHQITVTEWDLEIDNCKVTAIQMPVMLAYSITIHKSQSLSLDSAVLDLADCFTDGQIYVALSRLRSFNTMYLRSFNSKKITINNKMMTFINKISV